MGDQKLFEQRFKQYKDLDEAEINEGGSDEILYGSRFTRTEMPKNDMPKESMPARQAKQLVLDMCQINANPRLDLASFVTTWMEPEAEEIIAATQAINMVDVSQYPQCAEMEQRCVRMLGSLWHAPKPKSDDEKEQPLGASTIGSSEACMLGGLALKRRWQVARKKAGKPTDKPNLVLGANAQVCWEKFCEYWDVEGRYVPVTKDYPVMNPEDARKYMDENTIGLIVMFGSTYNGQFEDVVLADKIVGEVNKKNGWDMRIHVDGASGAMVAPFVFPEVEFDFRVPHVSSINCSGHKYGLVYPGVGWVVWRNRACVDESLIFHVAYLGTDQPSLNLNFSKNANMVVAQYYQFLRLGFEGYRKIMSNLMKVSAHLAEGILATGHFKLIGGGKGLPLVAFALKDGRKDKEGNDCVYDEYDVMARMKEHHWQIPAYTLPDDAKSQKMLRVTVREDFSYELATDLINDLKTVIEWLDHHFIYSEEKMHELRSKFHPHHPAKAKQHKHLHPNNKKRTGVC
ncbi:hypothetical protein CVIRNUC_010369 [Coccomyxa viridis]|uniref:Glutamate decarboxylase n=1 Tax=Coccomyxa viridis TaxID=1274662 RepID=A0AAV1IMD3_9CHLO|nr:hypothetical protein CVIRNUC_010369 [Coccomyxa viridis]